MRVALLSAGPSLRKSYDPAAAYDLRIGVNTAVEFYPCDWWVCADSHRWREIHARGIIGRPRVFAIDAERDRTQCFEPDNFSRFEWTGWTDVHRELGAPDDMLNNSGPAALVLALWLGATSVDCFGVDMAGDLDATGILDGATHYRNEKRWATERGYWQACEKFVTDRGVKVTRHGIQP